LGFLIHTYPLTPIQIILIAFLNDLPILSLAYNRVKKAHRPSQSASKARMMKGLLFGLVGICNSLLMYFVMANVLHQPLAIIQTVFFLKLTVSGHMLIYVAHTEEKWYKFLPSKQVIFATGGTQIIASLIAFFGLLMSPISFWIIIFIWVWSFGWMQISDWVKPLVPRL
jgi:H+-transporting ATPase